MNEKYSAPKKANHYGFGWLVFIISLGLIGYGVYCFVAWGLDMRPWSYINCLIVPFVGIIIAFVSLIAHCKRLDNICDYNTKKRCYELLSVNPTIPVDKLVANVLDGTEINEGEYDEQGELDEDFNNKKYVIRMLNELINEGAFPGYYFDPETNRLAIIKQPEEVVGSGEYQTVICKSCGASNKIAKNQVDDAECTYCGNLLK